MLIKFKAPFHERYNFADSKVATYALWCGDSQGVGLMHSPTQIYISTRSHSTRSLVDTVAHVSYPSMLDITHESFG
jgi:hypothetical protein